MASSSPRRKRGRLEEQVMGTRHGAAVLLLVSSSWLRAQLTIENPGRLELPEQHAQVLFLNINRALEAEFHCKGSLQNRFSVRLVLGRPEERLALDDPTGSGTVYLARWDEEKFAASIMRLAMQSLLSPDRRQRILEEAARRTRATAPVSATQLRNERVRLDPVAPAQDSCIAGITNAAVHGAPCTSARSQPRGP